MYFYSFCSLSLFIVHFSPMPSINANSPLSNTLAQQRSMG